MADNKITEYNAHSAPATGDQFFMIGASEEYRIDYDALAGAILDKLTTKTYSGIGNANIISAIAALNSNAYMLKGGIAIPTDADLNTETYCVYGTYYVSSSTIATSLANCPVRTVFRMIVTAMSSGENLNYQYIKRTIISGTKESDYNKYTQICQKEGPSASWVFGSWKLEPTRAEVDALNSSLANKIIQVTWGKAITFPLAINHRFVVFIGNTALYTGINYSDRLTCNAVFEGTEGITVSATRDATNTTVTITADKSANISALVF